MKKKYHLILRLTENATTAVLLCHKSAKLISASQNVCSFMDPELGEVYDPLEIAYSVRTVIHQLLKKIKSNDITITDIQIISEPYGVLVWDKSSGMAITQMIKINTKKLTNHGRKKFHLTISKKVSKEIKKKPTVFQSGLHLNWLIESFPDIKKQMQKDKAYCGGVESWIIFNLTGLKSFVTDITHASETFLFDQMKVKWSNISTDWLGIHKTNLPDIIFSAHESQHELQTRGFVPLEDGIQISSCISSHHASFFLRDQTEIGSVNVFFNKNCVIISVYIGLEERLIDLWDNLSIIPANGKNYYAIEKMVTYFEWPENLIADSFGSFLAKNIDCQVQNNVVMVPYENVSTGKKKLSIVGLGENFCEESLANAYLESIFYQVKQDLFEIEKKANLNLKNIHIFSDFKVSDGVIQLFSNILQMPVVFLDKFKSELVGLISMNKTDFSSNYKKLMEKNNLIHLKNIIPSQDPITMYTIFNNWEKIKLSLSNIN